MNSKWTWLYIKILPKKEGREEGKERRNEGGREPVRKEREVTEDWNSHRKGWHLSCH
jgi:hypothetical protein